jgi:hypothetical protein
MDSTCHPACMPPALPGGIFNALSLHFMHYETFIKLFPVFAVNMGMLGIDHPQGLDIARRKYD